MMWWCSFLLWIMLFRCVCWILLFDVFGIVDGVMMSMCVGWWFIVW